MPTVDELLRQATADQDALTNLRTRLSHAHSYTERSSLQRRIRRLEDELRSLYAQYLKALRASSSPVTVFGTTKKPRVYAGLSVHMDISTDGYYFSNPAPKIKNSAHVWVRLRIDIAQKSPFSTTKTVIPEFMRCTWVIPKRWASRDIYSKFGRVEYLVSNPLIITREFTAPSSGSVKANFGCYVDPYYPIEDNATLPPDSAPIEGDTVTMTLNPRTTPYRIYTRTSNVLTSYENVTVTSTPLVFEVDESDIKLFYTDGATYLVVRPILSGIYSGKYIIAAQTGIVIVNDMGTTKLTGL